jgi:hypothetical protein
MIKINIKGINEITVKGHANYDTYGKDIVCASVSSILITTINAIVRIDENSIDYNELDGVYIKVLKHTDVIDKLLVNLVELLTDLQKQYPKYIEIRRC